MRTVPGWKKHLPALTILGSRVTVTGVTVANGEPAGDTVNVGARERTG